MKEFFKSLRLNVSISAILTIILGIVLIRYPEAVPVIACRIIGAVMLVMGIVGVISNFVSDEKGYLHLAGSLIITFLGLWFLLRPKTVLVLIPIFMGIILIIHGVEDFKLAAETRTYRYSRWGIVVLCGILDFVLGLICICAAFDVLKLSMIVIGIALIYDGVSDIWIVSRVSSSARRFKKTYQNSQPIDVDYEEEDVDGK